jgi:DNA mismatch endonuclease (patch repair protein)
MGGPVTEIAKVRSTSRVVGPPAVVRPTSPHATATMRANRGRDTAPEVRVRSALHKAGLRFRKNARLDLPLGRVRPDIVLPRRRLAVFIDGCFWHGCPDHGEIPVGNRDFWLAKLERTRERDSHQTQVLEAAGWTVLRAWEHEPIEAIAARVCSAATAWGQLEVGS